MGLEAATFISELVGTNPSGSDFKYEGDNHLRMVKQVLQATFPGFAGRFNRTIVKGSGYTPVLNDSHALFSCSAALTLSMTAAATLGNGWCIPIYAAGDVTIDPNGAELVNGLATIIVPANTLALLFCDGTGFICASMPLNRGSGFGTITGNITLTGAHIGALLNITATAVVTLPAASAFAVGESIRLRSSTTGDVTIVRAGADTIDGLTTYRIPAYTSIEVMKTAAATFILARKPDAEVGSIRPTGASSAALGWSLMDQNDLNRTTEAGLFAVIGTTFGIGNGSTTFGKDARGRAMVAAGTGTSADNGTDGDVSTAADTLAVPSNTRKWQTGMAVVFTLASGTITGLTSGNTYYVIRNSATLVKLASSLTLAQSGTAIDFTAKSTPVWSITHTYEARALGERGGEESHAPSSTEVGPHRHRGLNSSYDGSASSDAFGNVYTFGPSLGGSTYSSAYRDTDFAGTVLIENTGGGVTANVRNPFLGTNYEIKL